jgi:signal transduction histidine kinase
VKASPKTLEQLAQLIGTKATLYFGNDDGNFWTDMIKPVSGPPVDLVHMRDVMEYKRNGQEVVASVHPVPNTHWLILIEFSRQTILETASEFLYWVIIVGVVLIIAGIFVAWLMSRNITGPLNELTAAAQAIAAGDYSLLVQTSRKDELGKLARTFNAMAVQVRNAQQELEKKVKDRTARLETVNKELEAFSYSVSHDLRTPLRAISGYSMMLKEDNEGKLDAEANRMIGAIIANTKMMGQLIDDLIAFSRLERKEVKSRPIDMKMLAESCLEGLLPNGDSARYRVHIDPIPVCAGDESMIKQVWINLLSNAIKYSAKEPGPSVEIGYKEQDSMNVYFIRDNGVGFDMQYAHKLFGVFQRLHRQEEFEGTGVGLALVKRIINKHSGEVWAESSPGKGASFYFSLPKNGFHE